MTENQIEAELIFCAFCDGFRASEFGVPPILTEGKLHAAATRYVEEVLNKQEEQDDD